MTMTLGMSSSPLVGSPEQDDMIGKALDHFTIIERLGGGGMGTVYRAMDESLQRYVAIKVIRRGSDGVHETKQVERLLQEARAQARVNHPNVVHIYFVSRDQRRPYLAMELVAGRTLASRIREGPLSYNELAPIALQIAEALRESTQLDIVHGDIKPGNILLQDDVAKLSDFGLSQRISERGDEIEKIAGTPNYMAPEVCRRERATAQSDMYSFGVMLFEMTFGRLPYVFGDSTIESRLEAHQNTAPDFPSKWPAEIPESWQPFMQRLLAKNAESRFADWDATVTELEKLQPLKPVAAGRLKRGIAWGLDLILLTVAQLLVVAPLSFVGHTYFPNSLTFSALWLASLLIVPALVMWWVGHGGSSPGKKLMQLRVVDRHGLAPRPRILGLRSMFQYLSIWCMPLTLRTDNIGMPEVVTTTVSWVVGLFLFLEVVLAIFRRGGRSLHDQIFDTRVVLFGSHDRNEVH